MTKWTRFLIDFVGVILYILLCDASVAVVMV
eukprot:CAMPEP_0197071560 /NCGR_PEP_ID=MMETSP1384-20130603/207383_1 /TAXON_ID=29189 /ORGANISM="Ammonia sp." /LENGTH=30 /DNA_ID= /DNA_START= /DNA_END= /DNA_ORIENTATION=